eukprot:7745461-Alexandrium_andersonii.AAC.1
MEAYTRKGGVQQRVKWARGQTPKVESELAKVLLTSYAWGDLSPRLAGTIAKLVCTGLDNYKKDLLNTNILETFRKLGTDGSHPENMISQLMAMTASSKMPLPAQLPGRVQKDIGGALAYSSVDIP